MANYDIFIKQLESLGEVFRKLLSQIMLVNESKATDILVAEIGDLMKSGIGLNLDGHRKFNERSLPNMSAEKETDSH